MKRLTEHEGGDKRAHRRHGLNDGHRFSVIED